MSRAQYRAVGPISRLRRGYLSQLKKNKKIFRHPLILVAIFYNKETMTQKTPFYLIFYARTVVSSSRRALVVRQKQSISSKNI